MGNRETLCDLRNQATRLNPLRHFYRKTGTVSEFSSPSSWHSVIYKDYHSILRDIGAVMRGDVSEIPDFACWDSPRHVERLGAIELHLVEEVAKATDSCKDIAAFQEIGGTAVLITGHLDSQLKDFFELCGSSLADSGMFKFRT